MNDAGLFMDETLYGALVFWLNTWIRDRERAWEWLGLGKDFVSGFVKSIGQVDRDVVH